MAAVLSVTGVVSPVLRLRLRLLRSGDIERNLGPTCSGCSKSICCDPTPIISSTGQRQFYIPAVASLDRKKGIQGFVCFFCSGGAAALPSTASVSSNSVLPRDVYSVTQWFDKASVPSFVNGVATSRTGSALTYSAVWPTNPGCARMLSANYLHPYPTHDGHD